MANGAALPTEPGAIYRYQVEGTAVVKPQDVDVLNAGLHPEMTLVTWLRIRLRGSLS